MLGWVEKLEEHPKLKSTIFNIVADHYRRCKQYEYGLMYIERSLKLLPNSGISLLIKCKIFSDQ